MAVNTRRLSPEEAIYEFLPTTPQTVIIPTWWCYSDYYQVCGSCKKYFSSWPHRGR